MSLLDETRKDFPILDQDVIYFDNAATSQSPSCVMEAASRYYETTNANPLRGLYEWSVGSTKAYEDARENVASFIGAKTPSEIIFTRNATESLNLVAFAYALKNLKEGDEITLSVAEHHSNLLPWQMVRDEKKIRLNILEPNEQGEITEEELDKKITEKTALLALGHVSNVLGVTNDVKAAIKKVHAVGGIAVIDGAQSAPHIPVDVSDIDADFYAFSGHKMLSAMGIGVLYGKKKLLEETEPFLRGGEMIEYVTLESATYAELPHKFEAGTVNVGGAVGLSCAIDYIKKIGLDNIARKEELLTKRLMEGMKELSYITIYGSDDPSKHSGIVSFRMDKVHPHDLASLLNEDGICIRAGHHCAQPLMQYLNVGSLARASLYFYNTLEEVDIFLEKLSEIRNTMGLG